MRRSLPGRRVIGIVAVLASVSLATLVFGEPGEAAPPPPDWAIQASPNQGTGNNNLNAVSCPSETWCRAVGYYVNSAGTAQTLAEQWDGSGINPKWSIWPSQNKTFYSNNLQGISCAKVNYCEAVGYYVNSSGVAQTLIEKKTPSGLKIETSPNAGTGNNYLYGVSCANIVTCTAVGSYYNGSVYQTLIEFWSGGTWSIQTSPNASTSSNNNLNGVSCIVGKKFGLSCKAVGYVVNPTSGYNRTLFESYGTNGWTVQNSPNASAMANTLYGVSCTSATSCQAVGNYLNPTNGVFQTLIGSWSCATGWCVATGANPSTTANYLNAVSCNSGTSCQAVGDTYNTSGVPRTLMETWNGTTWAPPKTAPNNGGRTNILNGVSCFSPGYCEAVGYYLNSSGVAQTLIEFYR
jgi:hypothetical protein